MAALLGGLAPVCVGQNNSPISLDTNETLFAVLAAINSCGYDQSLTISDAMRTGTFAVTFASERGGRPAIRRSTGTIMS